MPTARIVNLSQNQLEYFEHGHGPRKIAFIHGFEASARIWTEVQQALPVDRYTSVAINNRGAGNSHAPTQDSDFGVEPFAADAFALLQFLRWRGFTLVGHSMGGATATRFALDHPDLLEGLVLLNPASPDGRPGTPEQIELRVEAFLKARRLRLAQAVPAPSSEPKHATSPQSPDWRVQLDHDMANAPERRLRGSMRSMHAQRMGADLNRLTMPALLACGDQDDLIALPDLLETWRKLPKGAGLQVWHGVGHSPNLECPAAFAALLRQFVDTTALQRGQRSA